MRRSSAALAALLLTSCGNRGEPHITASGAWAREVAPGRTSAAVYVTISNRGDGADRLVGASTSIAANSTLHSSSSDGGVMRMRPISDGLEIPAQSTIAFEPGGNHIMLTGLKRPLRAGQTVEIVLVFERSDRRPITVRILPATATGGQVHGMTM